MIDVSIQTSPCADPKILIGRQAENNAVNIVFDLSFLIQNYGDGTAVLVHQRTKDDAPYIVTTQQDGSTLSWNVSNIDTAYVGVGQAELRWTVGETLAKTIIYKTWVTKSITAYEIIPDPYQSWYDAMIEYIDENSISQEELGDAVAEYIAEHPIEAPVMSVNNKTGAVVLTASDVGAGTYTKPSGGIPKTDLTSAVQTSLGKADTALQTAPVTSVDGKTGTVTILPTGGSQGQVLKKTSGTDYAVAWENESGGGGGAVDSVNGQTGVVVLDADDVGALPDDTTIPTKTSQLQNDSGFITSVPVTSVNSKTGAVTLTASDVGAGTYSKPSGGIPKTDLTSSVQTSLNKADTALQSYTETDPTVPSWAKASSKPSYTAQEIGAIAAPSSPATGAFLVWNGSAWVAQTLSTWQGGNY